MRPSPPRARGTRRRSSSNGLPTARRASEPQTRGARQCPQGGRASAPRAGPPPRIEVVEARRPQGELGDRRRLALELHPRHASGDPLDEVARRGPRRRIGPRTIDGRRARRARGRARRSVRPSSPSSVWPGHRSADGGLSRISSRHAELGRPRPAAGSCTGRRSARAQRPCRRAASRSRAAPRSCCSSRRRARRMPRIGRRARSSAGAP